MQFTGNLLVFFFNESTAIFENEINSNEDAIIGVGKKRRNRAVDQSPAMILWDFQSLMPFSERFSERVLGMVCEKVFATYFKNDGTGDPCCHGCNECT